MQAKINEKQNELEALTRCREECITLIKTKLDNNVLDLSKDLKNAESIKEKEISVKKEIERLTYIEEVDFPSIINKCKSIQSSIRDIEKELNDKKNEFKLLWQQIAIYSDKSKIFGICCNCKEPFMRSKYPYGSPHEHDHEYSSSFSCSQQREDQVNLNSFDEVCKNCL
jgi:hypothetical protein